MIALCIFIVLVLSPTHAYEVLQGPPESIIGMTSQIIILKQI
jgi:hypothetical protein